MVQVYSWFLTVHKASVFGGLAGYLLTFLELLGLVALLARSVGGFGLVLAWYGLYFGILNRDAAEVCSNRLVRLPPWARYLSFPTAVQP